MKKLKQGSLSAFLGKKDFVPTGETLSFEWEYESQPTLSTTLQTNEYVLFEEKYKPVKDNELFGQTHALEAIKAWKLNPLKPLLMSGPSGCGKSSLVHMMFQGYSIWNESFLRDDENLLENLKQLLERKPLFQIKRVIILDCLEGFQANELTEIQKILSKTKEFYLPVILICDDEYALSKELRNLCISIKLTKLSKDTFFKIIRNVVDKEDMAIGEDMIESLFDNCMGNVRFALNELQFLLQTRKRTVKAGSQSSLCKKDGQFQLFDATQTLFSGTHLGEDYMVMIQGEHAALSKIVHENAWNIHDFKYWEALSQTDLLEYKNEEMANYILAKSTSICSKKMNFNGPRKLNFPSYYEKEGKRLKNEIIKKKQGTDKLPLYKWVFN